MHALFVPCAPAFSPARRPSCAPFCCSLTPAPSTREASKTTREPTLLTSARLHAHTDQTPEAAALSVHERAALPSVGPVPRVPDHDEHHLGVGTAGAVLALGVLAALASDEGRPLIDWATSYLADPRFPVVLCMGVSSCLQAVTGFGFSVVSMGALSAMDWVVNSSVFDDLQPVIATLGAITGWALLAPDIHRVKWRNLGTLLAASTLGTPFGGVMLSLVDARIALRALGVLISGYVAYSLTGVEVPKKLGDASGALVLGALAGALGGAFDISAPPLCVHADARKWEAGTFKRNVLAVASVNATIVVIYDAFVGRLNHYWYWQFVAHSAPAVVLGLLVGNWLASRLDGATFKKIVLGTCMALGAKLLLS